MARGLAQDIPPDSLAFFRWLTAAGLLIVSGILVATHGRGPHP